jgi:hypothetical protein
MKIDIDSLTEAELIDLNNRIVARLRFFNQMRAHAQMLEFKIGDRVAFQPADRPLMVGMLTRYNRRPSLLSPTAESTGTSRPAFCGKQGRRRTRTPGTVL